jgi:hypothetical protein
MSMSDQKKSRRVFITAGGRHYHYFEDCEALADGWKIVEERGGECAPLEIALEKDVESDRKKCRTCRRRLEVG